MKTATGHRYFFPPVVIKDLSPYVLTLRSHCHLQQHHLPAVGGMRLGDVPLEPRRAEERGWTLFAGEDLLLLRSRLRLTVPGAVLLSLCVEHIRSESPSERPRQQLIPHRVPHAVLVPDFSRREARAAQVAQEHLCVSAVAPLAV